MDIKSEEELKKNLSHIEKAVVLFYASWCPFSQRFLPTYRKLEKEKGEKLLCVMVDNMEDTCAKYDIDVYPTVLFFEKGKVVRRLDGVAGQGLNEKDLTDFIGVCKV
jgi:thioredoxin 1